MSDTFVVCKMSFCNQCGSEVKKGTKFCSNCGASLTSEESTNTQQNSKNSGIPCPKCGSIAPFGNVVCNNCGSLLNPDKHTAAIVLGYICSIFAPIIGIIFAIYLLTRPNKDVHKHGIIMIILAIVLIIVYYLFFSYMAYVNSMHYYRYYYY